MDQVVGGDFLTCSTRNDLKPSLVAGILPSAAIQRGGMRMPRKESALAVDQPFKICVLPGQALDHLAVVQTLDHLAVG